MHAKFPTSASCASVNQTRPLSIRGVGFALPWHLAHILLNMIRAGLRGLSRCPRRLNFFWPFDFASAASVDCNLPLPALPGRAFHTAGSPHELPRSYLVYQSRKVNSAASAVCPVPITKSLRSVKNVTVASTSRKFQCVFDAVSYSTCCFHFQEISVRLRCGVLFNRVFQNKKNTK